MKHPEAVLRIFKKTDEEMLQQSEVKQALFIENKSSFVERFPQLADPFANEWASTTATAREILPDYESVNNQTSETKAIDGLLDEGRTLFQTLMLYTQLAFPGNATVLRLMGQSQYDSARGSQLKLPVLLRTAYKTASKPEFKAELIAKGMKETEIDSLETLAESIVNQNIAQEKAKKDRSLDSNQRILAMNAVYERMALVCQCAKLVFQNDAALYSLFLLDDSSSTSKSVEVPPVQTVVS